MTDNLVVRSKPWVGADSIIYRGTLQPGMILQVRAGPVEGSGYWWYRVELMLPPALDSGANRGWVAAADHDGEPWIEQALEMGIDPISLIPVTITDVVAPAYAGGPASFGVQTVAGATCEPSVAYGEGEATLVEPFVLETKTADGDGRTNWSWRVDAPFPAEWANVSVSCETVADDYGAGYDEVEISIVTVAPTPSVTPPPTPSIQPVPTPTPVSSATP